MPGVIIEVACAGCGAEHVLRVGHGDGWSFEHHVCHRCRTIRSIPVSEEIVTGPCPACGLQLERWAGTATVDSIVGPCSGCLEALGPGSITDVRGW